jgi:predicted RNase H-like HicB family nuclease/DNA-binding XRE family transcriptional regulator
MGNNTEWIDLSEDDAAAALRYALVIEWSPEDDAFVVSVPDIPGLHTHGSTREEAATMGDEALALWITGARRRGVPLPPPAFSPLRAYAAAIDEAERIRAIRQRLDVSQRDFAEMLNVSVSTVRSWEQGLRVPDGASLRLLDIAERQPEVLMEAPIQRQRRSA